MQTYYFILSEDNYKYYSSHSHTELLRSAPSYLTYSDAKKEIDRLRKIYPERKLDIYAVFTTLEKVEE